MWGVNLIIKIVLVDLKTGCSCNCVRSPQHDVDAGVLRPRDRTDLGFLRDGSGQRGERNGVCWRSCVTTRKFNVQSVEIKQFFILEL